MFEMWASISRTIINMVISSMVKNCYGFIPRKYRLRPRYTQERHSWCAIFSHPTEKIKYKIKIFADLMDGYKTGRYLYLYKKLLVLIGKMLMGIPQLRV